MIRANIAAVLRVAIAGLLLIILASAANVAAQPLPAEPPPERVDALLKLLADPEVRAWLERRAGEQPTADRPTEGDTSIQDLLNERLAVLRTEMQALFEAAPTLWTVLSGAWSQLTGEMSDFGLFRALLLIAAFVGLGFAVEWIYWRLTPGVRHRIVDAPSDTIGDRLGRIALRTAFSVGWFASFGVGSVGAFLAFDWPPMLRQVVLGYLIVFLLVRLAQVLSRLLLSPPNERLRIVPMPNAAAVFWQRWLAILIGWFVFARVTIDVLRTLGVEMPHLRLVGLTNGVILMFLLIAVAWLRPVARTDGTMTVAARGARTSGWFWTAFFVVLLLLFAVGTRRLAWLWLVALALPALVGISDRTVAYLLRPPGQTMAQAEASTPSILAACLDRGMRLVLFAGALWLLTWAWGVDMHAMMAGDSMGPRLVRQAFSAIVIVLVADFAWHVLKTWIDRTLATTQDTAGEDVQEARRRARIRTLLPIMRNAVLAVLLVMTVLMVLASIGVEIAPLVASAGVVGLAVGFGAQTLVKDIISGVFFLLDDAFRVGEYIVSGSYKGTVESFSLRSIKLRHHRGPLYTVPFGALGAVQNMSRDWVIEKLSVGVTYDTDLDKLKKVVKQISKEIMENPELAKDILEPLKLQGVEKMGDFAIDMRMKFKARPGQQFTVRRLIFAKLKKAFAENGIHFAYPTVQIAGPHDERPDEAAVAAARRVMPAPTV
ncbi:MAG TPA: mechanosensitive ion channel family protein [Alphaproteobacteria bacterium]|nr:mechanosensitive ion channel family protein [Alphaproteobacteria bacterium]